MRTESAQGDRLPTSSREWVTYGFLTLCLVGVHAALISFITPEVWNGSFVDPDGYTRLVRVTQLHETGEWFNHSIQRINPPFGLEMHWTRPLDVLLLLPSWVLSPVLGFQRALLWSGMFLSPVLHILTCLGLVWAAAPLFEPERRPLVLLAFLAQPVATSYGLAGRADHHMLLLLLYALALGWFFRLISRPARRWTSVASGVMSGLGLWVSVEFLLPLLTLYGTMALLWVVGFPKMARRAFLYSLGVLFTVAIAVAAEHKPSSFFLVEFDRISVLHLMMVALAAGSWYLIRRLEEHRGEMTSVRSRAVVLFSVTLFVLGGGALIFPGILSNPMSDTDPRFWTLFLRHIDELQPLFPTDLSQVGRMVSLMGAAMLVVPFALWRTASDHDHESRAVWLTVSIALCAFVALGLYQVRYGIWAGVPAAVAAAGILATILRRLGERRGLLAGAAIRAALISACLIGPFFLGEALSVAFANPPGTSAGVAGGECSTREMSDSLSNGDYGKDPRTLVAGPNLGPELVYRTPHRVVLAPYHRNSSGVLDGYEMLASTNDTVSRSLMKIRGVDLVILCPARDSAFFQQINRSDSALFARLVKGEAPAWIRPIPGAAGQSGFLVFEVDQGDGPPGT